MPGGNHLVTTSESEIELGRARHASSHHFAHANRRLSKSNAITRSRRPLIPKTAVKMVPFLLTVFHDERDLRTEFLLTDLPSSEFLFSGAVICRSRLQRYPFPVAQRRSERGTRLWNSIKSGPPVSTTSRKRRPGSCIPMVTTGSSVSNGADELRFSGRPNRNLPRSIVDH